MCRGAGVGGWGESGGVKAVSGVRAEDGCAADGLHWGLVGGQDKGQAPGLIGLT